MAKLLQLYLPREIPSHTFGLSNPVFHRPGGPFGQFNHNENTQQLIENLSNPDSYLS